MAIVPPGIQKPHQAVEGIWYIEFGYGVAWCGSVLWKAKITGRTFPEKTRLTFPWSVWKSERRPRDQGTKSPLSNGFQMQSRQKSWLVWDLRWARPSMRSMHICNRPKYLNKRGHFLYQAYGMLQFWTEGLSPHAHFWTSANLQRFRLYEISRHGCGPLPSLSILARCCEVTPSNSATSFWLRINLSFIHQILFTYSKHVKQKMK